MQNLIKSITILLLIFILTIFYLSLNRSSNYDTKYLVGNKLTNIELESFDNSKIYTNDDFKRNNFTN